jgi:hypothetical protein
MTPGVVWQLTDHYERGGHEAEQAHAHLAARIRRILPRRLGRVRPSPRAGMRMRDPASAPPRFERS